MSDFFEPTHISKESLGRVRALRQRVLADSDRWKEITDAAIAAAGARWDRYPGRSLRPAHIQALLASFHAANSDFRLIGSTRKLQGGIELMEIRVAAGTQFRAEWQEHDLTIAMHTVKIGRRNIGLKIESAPLINFNFHAMARRLDRGRDRTEDALLRDVAVSVKAHHDLRPLAEKSRFTIPTPLSDGHWYGTMEPFTVKDQPDDVGRDYMVAAVRTWY
jgi:hypothetical protein